MAEPVFLKAMQKGRQEETVAESRSCIFFTPLEGEVKDLDILCEEDRVAMEFTYGEGEDQGRVRLTQMDTNLLLEETEQGLFRAYLEGCSVDYISFAMIHALRFKVRDLTALFEGKIQDLKELEDKLDNRLDNACAYDILDFRRMFAHYGEQLITAEEFMTRSNKGYYPVMLSARVLAGEMELEFQFVRERYDLVKDVLIKDMDTYTSIVNNNINRNTRLLSIISLVGVVLNFFFGALLQTSVWIGIVGGLIVLGLSAAALIVWRWGKRFPASNPGGSKKK